MIPMNDHAKDKDIALCLSGGGCRAIAFHLGCLKALHKRKLLDRVKVVSAVSGGSIIAAMYAYSEGPFDEFEDRVRLLLREGLASTFFKQIFFSRRLLFSIFTHIFSGITAFLTDILRGLVAFAARRLGIDNRVEVRRLLAKLLPPFARWSSRTLVFEDTLHMRLFGGKKLSDRTRDGIDIVLNSCELTSCQPFRFSNRRSGCRGFGDIKGNDIYVAHAVAASAAYPIFLPAIDRTYEFVGETGIIKRDRVFLTDGGVFDNLGMASVEPEHLPGDDYNLFPAGYIICCAAGQGEKRSLPYWLGPRLIRSSDVINRKFIAIGLENLKRYLNSGLIKGFAFSYLSQDDSEFPERPRGFVKCEDVESFPTNFFPMKETDIERLAARGEVLMEMTIEKRCPAL